VGALLIAALVVALILLVRVNRGDEATPFPDGTTVPGATGDQTVAPAAELASGESTDAEQAAAPVASGDATIVGVRAWDPDGDNGSENDAQAGLALADGIDTSFWSTECYQDRYLGGKRGVGLILELSSPSSGTLAVTVGNGPYQLDVFATAEATAPTQLETWSQIGATRFADDPGALEINIDMTATNLLVWLKELGEDDACSGANPYRGQLGEISFQP
jgi:hypothetical protein